MKKGLIKKREYGLDFYLEWGTIGLKVSLLSILLILIFSLFLLFLETRNIYRVYDISVRFPDLYGLIFMYGGIILFIVIPFIAGILIGRRMKRKKF